MDDSLMEDSVFDEGASSDFAPPAKPAKATKVATKPKAPATKKAAGPAKPRGRPAGAAAKPKAKTAPKKKAKAESDMDENSDIDMDEDPVNDDESLLKDTPPKAKKAPAPKKSSGKPLADIANESFGADGDDVPVSKPKKGGASSKYQMVSVQDMRAKATTNPSTVDASGAHHEAARHIYWLRRATDG
jgi:DNA topoisomerase-2